MAYLILVRHGKSEWNALGLWTGWKDISLSDEGRLEAKFAAEQLQDIQIDKAHSSSLVRAKETLEIILKELNTQPPTFASKALNERDYGVYTGKNKWEIKKELGEEAFEQIRRGWNYPIPEGETLEVVYERIIPYFETEILEDLKKGENVLIVAHNNSLRALVKHLENLGIEEVVGAEIGTGEVHIYEIDLEGKVVSKEVKAENRLRGQI